MVWLPQDFQEAKTISSSPGSLWYTLLYQAMTTLKDDKGSLPKLKRLRKAKRCSLLLASASNEASSLGPSALAGRTAGGALPVVPNTRDTASLGRRRFKGFDTLKGFIGIGLALQRAVLYGGLIGGFTENCATKGQEVAEHSKIKGRGCRASGTRRLL